MTRLGKYNDEAAQRLDRQVDGLEKKIDAAEKRLNEHIKTIESGAGRHAYTNGRAYSDSR